MTATMEATVSDFVHRPTRVSAVQWRGDNGRVVASFVGQQGEFVADRNSTAGWLTVHGASTMVLPVPCGAWVVRDAHGRLGVTPADAMRESFEPVA